MTNNRMTHTASTGPTMRTRAVAAIVAMLIPLGVVLGSFFHWRERLPIEIASHWSGAGVVDGVMTVPQLLTVALLMTGVPALLTAVVVLWPGVSAHARRNTVLILGVFAGAGAASWLTSVTATMQAGDPYQAGLGPWAVLGLVAAGYGLIPYLFLPVPPLAVWDVDDRIAVAPGTDIAWSRTVTATLFLWVAGALAAVGIVLMLIKLAKGDGAEALIDVLGIFLVTMVLVFFGRFRVTADWRGLRVVSWLFRIPLKRIRLEDISAVEADELRPMEWGGWGYRISSGRSALILRAGPGLIVTTTNQKQFAITLAEPELPAAVLATLRDSRARLPVRD